MRRLVLALIPLGIFSLLCVLFWRGLALKPQLLPSVKIGQALPSFTLPVLNSHKSLDTTHLPNRYFLLHVFASWCDTCSEENLFLLKVAKEVPIVGLNYKDNETSLKHWLTIWGNPFLKIALDNSGKIGIELGVYGTPETFLISPQHTILYRHVGALTEDVWQKEFISRMRG